MMKKLVAALTTAFVAVALVVVGAAAPASAHSATVGASNVCTTATGAAVVTWSLTNDYSKSATVTASSDPAIVVGTVLAISGAPGSKATFTENVAAPAAGKTISATVTITWSDNVTQTSTPSTTVASSCTIPTPTDASAALVDTPASCTAAETVSEGAVVNASWFGAITYNGASYTAVAHAASGHKFPAGSGVTNNGETLTLHGTLHPKLQSGCAPPPKVCIPDSAVSYTYSANDSNSGTITVVDVPNSTGKLCNPFYVTATSWVFTSNSSIWPQTLDVVDKLGKIDSVGTYDYAAQVTCGQGDIYASTDENSPSLNPVSPLNGPSNPFTEHFLSDMGFAGNNSPTYIVDNANCWQRTPETGTPTTAVATCSPDSSNTLNLPAVPGGVWTVTGSGYSNSYGIGDGATVHSLSGGYETYTITLTDGSAHDGYNVTSSGPWTWTPVDKSGLDCSHYEPSASDSVGDCTYQDGSSETVTFTFTNTASNKPVTFTIASLGITDTVPAGQTDTKSVQVGTAGGSYEVVMTDSASTVITSSTIEVSPFAGCQPESGSPSFTLATCAVVDSAPTADLPAVPGGKWTITDGAHPHTYGVGLGVSGLTVPDGFVDYTITLTDGDNSDGYVVTTTSTDWNPQSRDSLDCAHYAPSSSSAIGVCQYVAEGGSTEAVTFTFDNTASNRAVTFSIASLGINVLVAPGATATAAATVPIAGATYTVEYTDASSASVGSQDVSVAGFTDCALPGDPSVVQQTCGPDGGLVGGSITVDLNPELKYSISGGPDGFTPIDDVQSAVTPLAAGSYIVSVVARDGFELTGADSWPLTIAITPLTCTVVQASALSTPASCTEAQTSVEGSVTVVPNAEIQYTINGAPVSQTITTEGTGTYVVDASLVDGAAALGYVLTGPTEWTFTLFDGCLTTLPAFHANATSDDAVCTDGSPQGTITLEHDASELGKIGYKIQKIGSATITDLGTSATTTHVGPGTYHVTAYTVNPEDGFQGESDWTLAIAWDGVPCASTTTLAFTGGTIGLFGLALAGSMLFLGIAALYIRRRGSRSAE
jgi:hypothetical protein